MKGQMFLITAAIIISLLVTLKAYSDIQQSRTEKDILDVTVENLIFENIVKEMEQVAKFSAINTPQITNNIIDYINFTRNGTERQGFEMEGIFIGVKANYTNQTMNITVLNFVDASSVNFTIRLDATRNSTLLNDFDYWNSNFSYSPGTKYNLTIMMPDKAYEKNVTVETKNNADVYVAYYDISLLTPRATHRNVFQKDFKLKP